MPAIPPDPTPGTPLTAALVAFLLGLARMGRIEVVEPLIMPKDNVIALSGGGGFWAQLTASDGGGNYSWQEQTAMPGGGWAAGPRSGNASLGPAVELNGNASVTTPKYVRMWWSNGVYLFQYGSC